MEVWFFLGGVCAIERTLARSRCEPRVMYVDHVHGCAVLFLVEILRNCGFFSPSVYTGIERVLWPIR